MKVLVSAYACEPGKGSEPEVGLQVALAAARHHEVWVLTRDNNMDALRGMFSNHPLRDRITFEPLDLPGMPLRAKRLGMAGLQWYYDRWQRQALVVGRDLDRRVGFDLVHHATFATYWARAGLADLGKPMVLGPVGGAVELPASFWTWLGMRGVMEEAQRRVGRRLMASRRVVRHTIREATIVLAQNPETAARISRLRTGPVVVVPNATGIAPPEPGLPPPVRGKNVVYAGRLVPWKAAPLAVEAMAYVAHPEARLLVFGDGPDRARVAATVRERGLADRVELCGRVPRQEVLRAIAAAGALVHPALHDDSPLVVAEALAMNTPVVALQRGGPAELIARFLESPGEAVEIGRPDDTARRMGAAIDRFLDAPAPAIEARHPTPTFEEAMLAAYNEAVALPG